MNVAKAEAEGRKLHKEGCSERAAEVRRGIPKAQIQLWTAENNDHIANLQTDNLLEGVLYPARIIFYNEAKDVPHFYKWGTSKQAGAYLPPR